ncbi:hypothetical protein Tco_0461089 [Tanacetum coccineum]
MITTSLVFGNEACRTVFRDYELRFEYSYPKSDGQSEQMIQTLGRNNDGHGKNLVGRLFMGSDWISSLTGLELVHETTDKEVMVKEKPKVARDHQKSYADNRRKPLEFKLRECTSSKADKDNLHLLIVTITILTVLKFMLIALIWKFDFSPFMVLIIAILNDGTIMTISKDKVKLSPLPDSLKLKEMFATSVLLRPYLVERFGVRSIRNEEFELMSALYLQVSIIYQALIFVTRSRSRSFIERPGILILFAFFATQLIATLIVMYANWDFAKVKGIGWGWGSVIWLYTIVIYIPLDIFQIYYPLRLEWKGMGQYARKKDRNEPNTSIDRLCLGENIQGSAAEGIENKEQWEGHEFQDTTSSGQEKEAKVFTFYRMEEEGERYFTPCYVGGLHAYDGEINLKYEKNLISNEFAVKLCLEYEEKNGEKLVKRELLVSLKGEFYFVKFIVNPEEDDVEPNVILGRSFMRLAKGIAYFGNGVITIHPELDPFLENFEDTKKFENDWDHLLDIDFGNIPEINKAGLPPFVYKMGKIKRNKKRAIKNFQLYYSDVGPLLSNGKPLTQEEAAREALAIDICKRVSILEEERPMIETMSYSDKYKKILDGIVMDKIKLDGEIKKEEE